MKSSAEKQVYKINEGEKSVVEIILLSEVWDSTGHDHEKKI